MQNSINKFFTVLLLVFTTTLAQAAPWGTIHGYKFNDINGNGIDNAEPRMADIKITIQNVGGVPYSDTDFTDALGRYSFTHLPFQTYVVCEVLTDPKWIPTTPQCVVVELTPKDSSDMVIFGNKIRTPNDQGCTRTQGFWGSSPQGQALAKILVPAPTTMLLGTNGYTAVQLDSILDAPVAGNALLILAHQLIAAKLNILAGAGFGAVVAAKIVEANTAIDGLVIPPVGAGFVAPASASGTIMVGIASYLDAYNKGEVGIPHCD